MLQISDHLQGILDNLPSKPGCYLMKDQGGVVIYVGKAISLKNRVRSYFHADNGHDNKTRRLVREIRDLEWILVGSELEALILEMTLIKKHRPKYNVRMKDDKRYPYIKIHWQEDFPRVTVTRLMLEDGARYFGPYTSAWAVHQTLDVLRRVFPWLSCDREITGTAQFLELVKADVFQDQVFVYTPKGEIKNLPAGSTPVDFAYHIHSGIGHRCIGAKVNGKLVPLTSYLRNGDTVEILVGKAGKGPSRDWLNPNLGYVNTSRARERIRQWFKKETRAESIEKGREILEKEMKRLRIDLGNREELAHLFKYQDVDDFYAAIGYGDLSASQVTLKLAVQEEQPKVKGTLPSAATAPLGIKVLGSGDLLTRLAKCCSPLPGDDIVGYITRTTGVTVHRKDCPNVIHEKERERLVDVEWGRTDQLYPVWIRVDAWDRVGLVRDITTVVSNEGVNIASMKSLGHGDNSASVFLTLETKGVAQLSRLLSKIEGIGGVTNVVRGSE